MAGGGLGGVRPSPGAASTEAPHAPDFIASPLLSNVTAPGDGRTPVTALPPSVTHYDLSEPAKRAAFAPFHKPTRAAALPAVPLLHENSDSRLRFLGSRPGPLFSQQRHEHHVLEPTSPSGELAQPALRFHAELGQHPGRGRVADEVIFRLLDSSRTTRSSVAFSGRSINRSVSNQGCAFMLLFMRLVTRLPSSIARHTAPPAARTLRLDNSGVAPSAHWE